MRMCHSLSVLADAKVPPAAAGLNSLLGAGATSVLRATEVCCLRGGRVWGMGGRGGEGVLFLRFELLRTAVIDI